MQDALESYKCGAKAGADFCFTETNKRYDLDEKLVVWKCNELAFSTSDPVEGGKENPGPLTWKNTISAVVLKAEDSPDPVDPDPVDPDPVDPPPTVISCVTTFYSESHCGRVVEGDIMP